MKSTFILALFTAVQISSAQMPQGIAENRAGIVHDLFNREQSGLRTGEAPVELFRQSESAEKKNVGLAAIYSFLLPGMGEMYAGEYGMGKYFTIAEGALWVTLIGYDRYAHWLQDDARQFAVQHAGSSIAGKEDQYFSDIADYSNIYAYNESVLKSRRPDLLYNPSSADYWKWDNDQNRSSYRDLRVASDERFNDTRFVVAAIGVNHLISAINAARLTYLHNKHAEEGGLIDLHASLIGGIGHPSGILLSVSRNF
jgi:TM2 domain-containing membrane protein YozV